jgi:hypothetical protein
MRLVPSLALTLICIVSSSVAAFAQKKPVQKHYYDMPLFVMPADSMPEEKSAPKALPQGDKAAQYAAEIVAARLKVHVDSLAGTYFQGRKATYTGGYRAGRYVANEFYHAKFPFSLGDTGFIQKVPMIQERWQNITLSINSKEQPYLKGYYAAKEINKFRKMVKSFDVVFAGYGVDDKKYSDYKGLKVKGKIVVILDGEPKIEGGKYVVSGSRYPSEWSTDWRKKLKAAKKKGASVVLIIDSKALNFINTNRLMLESYAVRLYNDETANEYLPNMRISMRVAEEIFGSKVKKIDQYKAKIMKSGKAKGFTHKQTYTGIDYKKQEFEVNGYNVVAVIPGTSKKNEIVMISANHDHLGKATDSTFYPGANANATGVAAMLEIAKAFYKAKLDGQAAQRTLVFVSFTGTEANHAGAKFYLESTPYGAMNQVVAHYHLNQIGRVDNRYREQNNYVYLLKAESTDNTMFSDIETAAQQYLGINIDYTYNDVVDPNAFFARSDAAVFEESTVPSVLFYGGHNIDTYTTEDTEDKIDYALLERISRLVFLSAWKAAN